MEQHFPQAPFAGKKIHLGVCGSVAAYKAIDLLRAFHKTNMRVTVSLTAAASRFITALSFQSLGAVQVFDPMFSVERDLQGLEEDPFGHLTPGREADAFLIAPASATTLSRLACGMADELLAAQALAWSGPLVLAPAMNPRMWRNTATQENCAVLVRRGHVLVPPETGVVACGDEGEGRFPDPRVIYLHVLRALSTQDLAGQKVLVTLGPTREPWDCVRFWSNHSTGLMGASLAVAAWLRGAEVYVTRGPTSPWLPPQIHIRETMTAKDMFREAEDLWPEMDLGIFAAAVADFSPVPFTGGKFKKSASTEGFTLAFQPNADILASLARHKTKKQRVICFAAESDQLEENSQRKLKAKYADILVGNLVGANTDSGFACRQNTVIILDSQGAVLRPPTQPKADLAWRILDCLSSR